MSFCSLMKRVLCRFFSPLRFDNFVMLFFCLNCVCGSSFPLFFVFVFLIMISLIVLSVLICRYFPQLFWTYEESGPIHHFLKTSFTTTSICRDYVFLHIFYFFSRFNEKKYNLYCLDNRCYRF